MVQLNITLIDKFINDAIEVDVDAICDGISTNMRLDNPDDRQIKIFKYDASNETWKKEEAQFIRKIDSNTGDILGIIRALTAKSYNQSLYLSGQYGSIKYDPNR